MSTDTTIVKPWLTEPNGLSGIGPQGVLLPVAQFDVGRLWSSVAGLRGRQGGIDG